MLYSQYTTKKTYDRPV